MAIEITETFYPKEKNQWRKWLQKNHNKKKEIWLVFYKKSTGKQAISYQDTVDEALCFGWIDGLEKRIDEERYGLRFTPRSKTSNWSETNVKRFNTLREAGLVHKAGEAAFAAKKHIYTSFSNKKGAIEWHKSHKMPKNATLEERINWHKEHKKYCGCRPIPKSLAMYFT